MTHKGTISIKTKRLILREFILDDVQNPASGKAMIQCGFQYEGLLRQGGRNSFGLVDCKQYAIIADDYYALRTKGASQ